MSIVKVTYTSTIRILMRYPYKNRYVVCCIYFNYNAAYMQIAHKRDIAENCAHKQIHLYAVYVHTAYVQDAHKQNVCNLHICNLRLSCML